MTGAPSLAGELDTTAFLRDLLERAAAAHGVHEAEDLGGVYDVNWPQWYAEHMTRTLAEAGYRLTRIDAKNSA
jgi:hypothetical protein